MMARFSEVHAGTGGPPCLLLTIPCCGWPILSRFLRKGGDRECKHDRKLGARAIRATDTPCTDKSPAQRDSPLRQLILASPIDLTKGAGDERSRASQEACAGIES